jgi:DMSO/TMAO reductase YedYZ molybdopterin-dependent catalytic subunit
MTGLTASAGVMLTGCGGSGPPTYGNILRMGDLVTYKAHRLLMPSHALVREYDRSEISSSPAIGNTNPGDSNQPFFDPQQGEIYARLQRGGFADWRLAVEGSVTRPGSFSLDDLKRMPSRTQITQHRCEEGWSAIAEWTGVPLRNLLEAVGVKPEARFVQLQSFDFFGGSIDMWDAMHPQTILAYGMNGRDIPTGHGAPVRLRVETQLGYRSLKFVRRILVTDEFQDDGTIAAGWSWYAGI